MNARQISVFVENKRGRLASIIKILSDAGVNIEASSLSDTVEYGVLHLIPNQFELAWETLTNKGFSLYESKVIIIKMEHQPGALAKILEQIENHGIDIEYMYALPHVVGGNALILFRFFDHESAVEKLRKIDVDLYEVEN